MINVLVICINLTLVFKDLYCISWNYHPWQLLGCLWPKMKSVIHLSEKLLLYNESIASKLRETNKKVIWEISSPNTPPVYETRLFSLKLSVFENHLSNIKYFALVSFKISCRTPYDNPHIFPNNRSDLTNECFNGSKIEKNQCRSTVDSLHLDIEGTIEIGRDRTQEQICNAH